MLDLTLVSGGAQSPKPVAVTTGVIAGWTGRDHDALWKHIHELEEIGVPPPAFTPIFYRIAAARFTTAPMIEVTGEHSSGEVEFALLKQGGKLWIGVGSDHTDRKVETYDITVSKQICDKPVAPIFWDLDDIADHWEQLQLESHIWTGETRTLYQQGSVAAMTPPRELMALYRHHSAGLPDDTLMFCGTLAAIGGLRTDGRRFEFSLSDPVLGRAIRHGYDIKTLPPHAQTVRAG